MQKAVDINMSFFIAMTLHTRKKMNIKLYT